LAELREATRDGELPTYVICRRGIASRAAAELLLTTGAFQQEKVVDIMGGLSKWSATVDSQFPAY
jgi:rhodanese-related sulfurtransferase